MQNDSFTLGTILFITQLNQRIQILPQLMQLSTKFPIMFSEVHLIIPYQKSLDEYYFVVIYHKINPISSNIDQIHPEAMYSNYIQTTNKIKN